MCNHVFWLHKRNSKNCKRVRFNDKRRILEEVLQRDQNIGQIAIAYTIWSKKRGGWKINCKRNF